eukprot:gene13042-gene3704
MVPVRVAVEWGFGCIYNVWTYLNYFPKQQLYKSVPALHMHLGFFLCNARNCASKNQIRQKFDAPCPSLQDYV